MKTNEVTNKLINKKVECVVTGLKTTGVVTGIIDNQWSKGVIIKLDTPVQWGDDVFTIWHSTSRKSDDFGNLSNTHLIQ